MNKRPGNSDDIRLHYWGAIEYISAMIKSSEIKAGLILSFYGIILNLLLMSIGPYVDTMINDWVICVLIFIWFLFTSISIYFSFKCFMPQLETKYEKNVFFFGDIVSSFGGIKKFSKLFHEISMDEDRLFDQLGQQIFVISKIATGKFRNVNRSVFSLAMSLFVLIIVMMYGIFSKSF